MKKIPIKGGSYAIVDDIDFQSLSKMKWRNEKGYAKSGGAYNSLYMHRIIANPPKDMQVDHINNNPLDNRRCNLRIVTNQQNQWNSRLSNGRIRKNKSGYKGVWKTKPKYIAEIKKDGKKYYLGSYDTSEEAAIAYNKKAIELFGEYASLNKI